MNALQVMEEVSALCSLGKVTSEKVFYACLNRALDEIGHAFPKKSEETIYHALPMPFFSLSRTVKVTPSSPLRIVSDAIHAYSVSAYGEGALTVAVNGERIGEYAITKKTPLSIAKTVKADFYKESGEVTLIVSSRSKLYVTAAALYGTPSEEAVLYRAFYRYPIEKFAHRFLRFDGTVFRSGKVFGNEEILRLTEDAVEIAFEKDGIYTVGYYALPDRVTEETKEESLYVREDAKHLVPLLTAYYYALEDGNEMAEALLSRYHDARKSRIWRCDERVSDVYGW